MVNPTAPDFTELGARKLAELQPNGYEITGKEPTISSPVVPDFTGVAARKLADLLAKGFVITGFCFERQVEGTQPQRGFVDFAGFVGWHQPSAAPMTAIQELSWCGNCGEGVTFFCRSKTVCECPKGLGRVTAHGVADMKGGQDVDA